MTGMLNQQDPQDTKRMMLALIIIGLGLVIWQVLVEQPRQHEAQLARQEEVAREQKMQKALNAQMQQTIEADRAASAAQAQSQAKVDIESSEMEGTIALQGGRINYLKLLRYDETTEEDSPSVVLLQPSGVEAYFIEFGWLAAEGFSGVKLPNSQSVWQASAEKLTKETPVTLSWNNGEGLVFETKITLKGAYLFNIDQRVINQSAQTVELHPYGYINRTFEKEASQMLILHEGPIGVLDETLSEISYDDLMESGSERFANAEGWLGITDKYWLTALIPHESEPFTGNFKAYTTKQGFHRYQADYMGRSRAIAPGTSERYQTLAFAGAKRLELLDNYAEEYNIPLFDRAVDLGILYFLTKPIFLALTWLYSMVSDFGLAIILLTVLIKMLMYPLANKSYVAMNEMKVLQPKLTALKERYSNDKMRFQQEMMALYKKEKINPAAGCLPLFIQIPVFFALYKVLFVTIEMRHANFYDLIGDLSAQEPTNIFNLFGLLEWTPPSFLHIGILAILMAFTMWLQQQLNPKPTDPVQAKVMGWLPWIFMVILAGFPAGLLLYWVSSNTLSILQQWSIKYRYQKRVKKRAANDV
jgi:YidC/Oxa1 family membrane protein insertase